MVAPKNGLRPSRHLAPCGGDIELSPQGDGKGCSSVGDGAASLLTLRAFPRFKKDRWEKFEDIVTPEEAYTIVWRCLGQRETEQCKPNQCLSEQHKAVEERQEGKKGFEGQQGQSNAGNGRRQDGWIPDTLEDVAGSDRLGHLRNESCREDKDGPREISLPPQQGGEVTLWAYPRDIAPLAVGHILLDVCPSEYSLGRNVHLTVENLDSNTQTASPVVLDAPTKTHALGEGENQYVPSRGKRYIVTIGGNESLDGGGECGASKNGNKNGDGGTCEGAGGGILPCPPAYWSPKGVLVAMDAFIEAEGLWDSTGCFHRAGVYDIAQGQLLTRAEDIGRHNCVDRLAGWSVLQRVPLSDKVLLVSARMTSSLCAKAIRAGFPVIVSRSAVTTAAIAMAQAASVTLIGFARTQEQRFTVFNQGKCEIYDEAT